MEIDLGRAVEMRGHWSAPGLLSLLALGLAACAGSSSHTAASTSSASASAASTSPGPSAPKRRRSANTTTAGTSASSTATAPPPAPEGTPAAPPGLRRTTGYGTYELCAGTCSAAVPAALRRPLHLPRGGCAAAGGNGPVKPQPGGQLNLTAFVGSSWKGARVTWQAAPSYTGPVLIRGALVGGSGAVGFGEGHIPYDELQLLSSGTGAPRPPGGGRAWLSFTRVRGPGCYAYQVDGSSFSEVIGFRAR